MFQIPNFNVYPYFEFIKRRKWWFIVPFFSVVLLGTIYMLYTPKLYKANTLVLYEGQSVSETYVESNVHDDFEERLQAITKQISSRSNLRKVLSEYQLYLDNFEKEQNLLANVGNIIYRLPFISEGEASQSEKKSEIIDYAKLEALRENIEVNFSGEEDRAFEIAFMWNDPEVAAGFANALTTQFIEDNRNIRKKKASGTTEFLSVEVAQLRNSLEKKEQQLEKFRKNNIGRLPEQLETNIDLLNQKKDTLDNLEDRLHLEKQRAMMLRRQVRSSSTSDADSGEMSRSDIKRELEIMRSRYTDKHPDVVALQERINKSMQRFNDQDLIDSTQTSSNDVEAGYIDGMSYTTYAELSQTRAQIENYEKQIAEVRKDIARYQQRIEETPNVEMQFRDLQRDYETMNERYQNILAKKLDAQMAEELENRRKGEHFKVVDSAIPPVVPFEPDLPRLGLITFLLGLGFGGGLAYLRESLDPTFYSAEDAENYLGRKILVSLPWEDSKEA